MNERMKETIIVFIVCPILCIAFLTLLGMVVGNPDLEGINNKTGYIENIEFVGGGFSSDKRTIIQFADGENIVLNGWKTSIPIKKNVTLEYDWVTCGNIYLESCKMIEPLNKSGEEYD